jgi:hypothetical protein
MLKHSEKVKNRTWISATLFFLGALSLAIGISRGEMGVVLRKAINICLECIGIG